MLHAWFVAISLAAIAAQPKDEKGSWVLQGRVLDSQRGPVADVAVSTFWGANGLSLEELHRLEKTGGLAGKLDTNEGRMEPWGYNPTWTDSAGSFSMKMKWNNYFLLAIDKERKRGAMIMIDPRHVPPNLEVKLGPLARFHGRLGFVGSDERPKDSVVIVRLPENEKLPLGFTRLAICSSVKSRFEFLLPPGDYELEAGSELAGKGYGLYPFQPIKLPAGQIDVDGGVLELKPESTRPLTSVQRINAATPTNTGLNIDYKTLYGKPAPEWHAVDARRIARNARVADFKGKWVIVYIWQTTCGPCLGRTLPALTAFYKAHEAERDRFEIIAICAEPGSEFKTLADVDQTLKPVITHVWGGRALPFPVVLDNTFETLEHWGAKASAEIHLIDPAGRLVPGDENTLAEKLSEIARSNANTHK
jgi:hypothetical protein